MKYRKKGVLCILLALASSATTADESLFSNESFKERLESDNVKALNKINSEYSIKEFLNDPAKIIFNNKDNGFLLTDRLNKVAFKDGHFFKASSDKVKVDWVDIKDFLTAALIYNSDKEVTRTLLENITVNPLPLSDFFGYVYNEANVFSFSKNISRNIKSTPYKLSSEGVVSVLTLGFSESGLETCYYKINNNSEGFNNYSELKNEDGFSSIETVKKNFSKFGMLTKGVIKKENYTGEKRASSCFPLSYRDNNYYLSKVDKRFDYLLSDEEIKLISESKVKMSSEHEELKLNQKTKRTKPMPDNVASEGLFSYRALSPFYVSVFYKLGGYISDIDSVKKISYVTSNKAFKNDDSGKDHEFLQKIYFSFKDNPKNLIFLNKKIANVNNLGFDMTGLNMQHYSHNSTTKNYQFKIIDKVIARSLNLSEDEFNKRKPVINLN